MLYNDILRYNQIKEKEEKLKIARKFISDVIALAEKNDLSVFVVTDGASGTRNRDCEAVQHARDCHKEWEREHSFDPEEDWSK